MQFELEQIGEASDDVQSQPIAEPDQVKCAKSVGLGWIAPDSSLPMSNRALSSLDMVPIACSCFDRASAAPGLLKCCRKVSLRSSSVCSGWGNSPAAAPRKRFLPWLATLPRST